MALKTKKDLDALAALSPEDRADMSSLFDSIEERNTQIATLKKQNEDADKVVKRVPELEKLLAEKETLSKELQEKLAKLTVKAPDHENFDDLLPFAELRSAIEEMVGDDAE